VALPNGTAGLNPPNKQPEVALPTPAAVAPPTQPPSKPPSAGVKVPVGRGRDRSRSRTGTLSTRRESVLVKPEYVKRTILKLVIHILLSPAILQQPTNKFICSKCQQPIVGVYITALDKIWHQVRINYLLLSSLLILSLRQDHFNCAYCQKNLEGTFFETDSGIICEGCALSVFKCSECSRPITGPHLVFEDGRTVHQDCVPKRAVRISLPMLLSTHTHLYLVCPLSPTYAA